MKEWQHGREGSFQSRKPKRMTGLFNKTKNRMTGMTILTSDNYIIFFFQKKKKLYYFLWQNYICDPISLGCVDWKFQKKI